jgi:YD repeat-containing protein
MTGGAQTTYAYDLLDRQTSMTFQDGSTRLSQYDLAGVVTGYADENGSVFANAYDALGRRTAVAVTPATGVIGTTAQIIKQGQPPIIAMKPAAVPVCIP